MPPRAAREEPRTPRAGLALVLALALGLQLWTLARGRGYPLADSVEYIERTQIVLAGGALDAGSVRSFGFSALLVPLVAVLGAFGEAAVLVGARLFTIALGLATVAVVARLATRLYGPRAGLAAAFVVAVNPIFLQWTVEPLSGTAAMLCVALAADALVERGGFRRGLLVGAFLGLALAMAFQTLAVLLVFVALLVARDRWKGRAHTLGVAAALAASALALALLDTIIYGTFGSSLFEYIKENVAGTLSSKLYELSQKTGSQALEDLAVRIYNAAFEAADRARQEAGVEIRSRFPRTWYAAHLHTHLFALPLLLLLGLGVVRAALRPRWATAILFLTAAGNAVAMSFKGEQSFRLWLPLLPLLAPFAGAGFAWLAEARRGAAALRLLGLALLALGAVQGLGILRAVNLKKHGGYWDAMDLVQRLRAEKGGAEERLAAGYHWATLLRSGGPGLAQEKLPFPLYAWPRLEPAERAAVLERLGALDWFVSHVQLFEQDPALAAVLAERFEVAGAFYDRGAYEELQPILVFRRAPPGSAARRLFALEKGADPGAIQATLAHPQSFDLRRRHDDGTVDQLVLLGWDADVLPGSGTVGWLELTWYAGPTHGRDYTINARITDPEDRARQVNRAPGWGAHPTSTLEPGWIVRDGLPFALSGGWDDLGGDYCRGDVLPLRLWLAAPRYEIGEDGAQRPAGGLAPFHPSGLRPVHKERREGRLVSDEGYVFSTDNLILVGGFFAPVPAAARVPDDGRPLVPR